MTDFPALLVVADRDHVGDDERWLGLLERIAVASAAAPVAIQVRARRASRSDLAVLAARARGAVPVGVPLLLNGDAQLAAALGYDGVHWPEAVLDGASAPGLRWRSAAIHSRAALRAAERAGADVLVFGSVFAPGSKVAAPAGTDALRAVASATDLPVLAIGGITPQRVVACLDAGARGVAVVSGILDAPSPADAVGAYLTALAAGSTLARG